MRIWNKVKAAAASLRLRRAAAHQQVTPACAHRPMDRFGSLLCGSDHGEGIAKAALKQLSSSIDDFSTRCVTFLKTPSAPDTLVFGPFCARALLENSCAALVGRLDSFRILYLSEYQSQPDYELNKRPKSAFLGWETSYLKRNKDNLFGTQITKSIKLVAHFSPRIWNMYTGSQR